MPRTAIRYARSNRRENLDRQVRKLKEWWCRSARSPRSRSGLSVTSVQQVVTEVAAGLADMVLIRDVSRFV
jgi:predicted site-specific integrase-resolvase